jgi:hypothetical protein
MNEYEAFLYERFLQEYVLAYRQSGNSGYDYSEIVKQAAYAWDLIQAEVKSKTNSKSP